MSDLSVGKLVRHTSDIEIGVIKHYCIEAILDEVQGFDRPILCSVIGLQSTWNIVCDAKDLLSSGIEHQSASPRFG